jgi:1-acyl-sn-glycerol-3-phosphate acyltransferase
MIMKLLKSIVARFLAFWALFMFAASMFVYMWFYLYCLILREPEKTKWHRKISQLWMGTFMLLSGIRFSVRGKHHFDGLENAVIVCNHNSMLDIPVSFPFLPRANKTIAKKSLSKVPIFGWIYSIGTVLVDRNDSKSRQSSYNEMKYVLNHGLDMLLYPEGTRNKTSAPLKSFYDGAFKLAIETQKPIVPVVLLNSKKMLPAKPTMYFRPGKITMNILSPVYPQGHTINSLKQEVYDIMAAYYLANEK